MNDKPGAGLAAADVAKTGTGDRQRFFLLTRSGGGCGGNAHKKVGYSTSGAVFAVKWSDGNGKFDKPRASAFPLAAAKWDGKNNGQSGAAKAESGDCQKIYVVRRQRVKFLTIRLVP